MALNAGNSACTTGLSKRIYDQWSADPSAGFSSSLTTAQQNSLKSLCWAVAKSVVDEIQANAQVSGSSVT
jgi:hypothetical protein